MRAASRVLLLALLLPLLACEKSPGGVHVVVSGPLTPGVDFDRLSVVASLPEGTPLAVATLEGDALKLPATFNFESGPATPEGTRVSVRATAERSGTVRSTTSGEATLTPGSGTTLELSLPPIPVPPDAGTPVEACDNGVDDDGDDLRDCADPDCDGESCQPGGLTCGGGVCGCAGGPMGTVSEQPGFTRRTAPLALFPAVGPYADTLVVTGGRDGAGRPVATVEVWSPESGGLARGSLLVARGEAAALALTDGGVVVLGGVREDGRAEASLERLEPDGGTTLTFFSPSLSSIGALAGRLGPDAVLAGGQLSQFPSPPARDAVFRVSLVSPGFGTQSSLGRLSLSCPAAGAALGDAFLLAGGCAGQGPSERTDVVEPSGLLGVGPSLPVALESPAVVDLASGRALVVGGREALPGGGLAPSSRAFLLERAGTVVRVRELAPMERPRAAPRAVRAGNGWVFVEDGEGAPPVWFDPAAERFTPAVSLPTSRTGHALTAGPEGRVYAVGGRGPDGSLYDTALIVQMRCP
ncbi:kelch repeat-containing protein [Myxococcus sp. RHSTA-1-4]|uniref:Kelch repeat-containing protein n=1 Tax=Myxococcus sp. RHSTA-1-4 TaxID=2874601 RepID=UPI00272EDA5B|nr:kelch repeat-containing protein [Myxococcus sp. RHSTA-1-4]MBZ4417596.1 hypothetical protein [Myxococcus sp. RHSTA-1-4]